MYARAPRASNAAQLKLSSAEASHARLAASKGRHYSLSKGWMSAYLKEDNQTCVHPPEPGAKLGPPGWGGAYAGSKPRCYASHDLAPRAQPLACDFSKPFSTSESFEPYGQFPKPHPKDREHWLTD